MTEKDLKEAAGKKLEEAYRLKSLEDGPSEETVAKWIAIADQRRAENRRRKKKILSCAAALALCICIGATCVLKTPNAVAGGSGGTKVEGGLTRISSYNSTEDLPDEIKEKFILFGDNMQGFDLVEATVEKGEEFTKFSLDYYDDLDNELFITEVMTSSDSGFTHMNDVDAVKENWGEIEVYIKTYDSDKRESLYSFIANDIIFTINTSEAVPKENVRQFVEKAVRN